MKVRVESAPPARGRDTIVILGTDLSATSPRFIIGPALSRIVSRLSRNSALASSTCGVSSPVMPRADAASTTQGMPLSINVRNPSIISTGLPVGNNAAGGTAVSAKLMGTGAAVPCTPSMRASPSRALCRRSGPAQWRSAGVSIWMRAVSPSPALPASLDGERPRAAAACAVLRIGHRGFVSEHLRNR